MKSAEKKAGSNAVLKPLRMGFAWCLGAVAMCVGICVGAVSDWMRIRDQAARSIGVSASFSVRVCHPSTLRMVI